MSSDRGYIQTVLGPIAPEEAGISLIHEHVLLDLTKGISGVEQYKTGAKKYVPIMRQIGSGLGTGAGRPGDRCHLGGQMGAAGHLGEPQRPPEALGLLRGSEARLDR